MNECDYYIDIHECLCESYDTAHFLLQSEYWSVVHTDWSRYPHLLRFSSFREVFELLERTDFVAVSASHCFPEPIGRWVAQALG